MKYKTTIGCTAVYTAGKVKRQATVKIRTTPPLSRSMSAVDTTTEEICLNRRWIRLLRKFLEDVETAMMTP